MRYHKKNYKTQPTIATLVKIRLQWRESDIAKDGTIYWFANSCVIETANPAKAIIDKQSELNNKGGFKSFKVDYLD